MKKLFFGFVVSLLSIWAISKNFDLKVFQGLSSRIQWWVLIFIILHIALGAFFFAVRWWYLIGKKMSLWKCFEATVLGLFGNCTLPARGGDVLRLIHGKKEAHLSYVGLTSKLFLEKVIDFTWVIFMGGVAFFLIGANGDSDSSYLLFLISGLIVGGMLISLLVLKIYPDLLIKILLIPFKLIKKEQFFHGHIENPIRELKEFLKIENLSMPLLITFPTWILGYGFTYYWQGIMIGVPVNPVEVAFVMFAAGMGGALPAAPSGVGVIHAAIITAFVIIGRPSSEGLIYGTWVHLSNLIIMVVLGLPFYLKWIFSKKPTDLDTLEEE